jgi:hypothetical protein
MPDDTLLTTFAHLTAAQLSAFDVLLATDGQSCALSTQMCSSLQQRGLLVRVVDELTQGTRLCAKGCGHAWYAIPDGVQEAYVVWSEPETPEAETPEPEASDDDPPVAAAPAPDTRPRLMRRPEPPTYWARIITPGTDCLTLYGQAYDRGELLTLPDVTGNEAFMRLDFVMLAPPDKAYLRAECGVCGHWFLNERFRDQHGAKRHGQRYADDLDMAVAMHGPSGGAALRDTTGDMDDRRQWVEYPPNLERSKASQQG